MMAIDVHAHMATPAADDLLQDEPGFLAQRHVEALSLGASAEVNARQLRTLCERLTSLDVRLASMDRSGIAVQTVSATPIARPWMDWHLAERFYDISNREVAEFCAAAPLRLAPVMSVALHHPKLAVRQLAEAVELGGVAVSISTSAGAVGELDAPDLDPLWAAAARNEIPVLIHPWGCSLGARLDIGYMFNHVGNPTETSVALSRLIFGGVFDRHAGLKVWAAHGGGWLPSYSGRADHAWHNRPDARTCANPPSWYLQRMWYDVLVYSASALRFLAEQVGSSRLTIGTDYPFDMGIDDPRRLIDETFPEPAVRESVATSNALQLFGPRLSARLE